MFRRQICSTIFLRTYYVPGTTVETINTAKNTISGLVRGEGRKAEDMRMSV